ncbi:hypothetical protein [Scatolibacter rhodanostii]|nr:hypothetical protein [Scatolibacter rhodanostii]
MENNLLKVLEALGNRIAELEDQISLKDYQIADLKKQLNAEQEANNNV